VDISNAAENENCHNVTHQICQTE